MENENTAPYTGDIGRALESIIVELRNLVAAVKDLDATIEEVVAVAVLPPRTDF